MFDYLFVIFFFQSIKVMFSEIFSGKILRCCLACSLITRVALRLCRSWRVFILSLLSFQMLVILWPMLSFKCKQTEPERRSQHLRLMTCYINSIINRYFLSGKLFFFTSVLSTSLSEIITRWISKISVCMMRECPGGWSCRAMKWGLESVIAISRGPAGLSLQTYPKPGSQLNLNRLQCCEVMETFQLRSLPWTHCWPRPASRLYSRQPRGCLLIPFDWACAIDMPPSLLSCFPVRTSVAKLQLMHETDVFRRWSGERWRDRRGWRHDFTNISIDGCISTWVMLNVVDSSRCFLRRWLETHYLQPCRLHDAHSPIKNYLDIYLNPIDDPQNKDASLLRCRHSPVCVMKIIWWREPPNSSRSFVPWKC